MIVSEKKGNLWQSNEACIADNYQIALGNKMNDDEIAKQLAK